MSNTSFMLFFLIHVWSEKREFNSSLVVAGIGVQPAEVQSSWFLLITVMVKSQIMFSVQNSHPDDYTRQYTGTNCLPNVMVFNFDAVCESRRTA